MAEISAFRVPLVGKTLNMTSLPVESASLPTSWSFEMVEERLVEALLTCWRQPDRERGWQWVKSAWPDITREQHLGDADARGGFGLGQEPTLRPASLTRLEVAEMEEAFGWADQLAAEERRLVGVVIGQLARGKRQVSWHAVARAFGMRRGSDGFRMRYGRAIARIADRLNGGNPLANVSMG